MAAKKRKSIKSTRKAVKKTTARRKPAKASKGRKAIRVSTKTSKREVSLGPISSVSKAYTKGQLYMTLAGRTGLQRKEISALFDELKTIIAAHVKKQGPGQFTIPGLVKLTVTHKPATKARKGINPFTGEEMMFKAKPARNVVKARALKQLKAMV